MRLFHGDAETATLARPTPNGAIHTSGPGRHDRARTDRNNEDMRMLAPFTLLRALLAALCLAMPALAAELPPPTGPAWLTVTGAIFVRNQADAAVFDLAALESTKPRGFATMTPWSRGNRPSLAFPCTTCSPLSAPRGATPAPWRSAITSSTSR